uniref:NADH dehydrogenase subunit 2 n=1 Tax=Thoradonta yunnana TaxID=515186 RepID=UPI0023AB1ECB|nr:NADH dehydrogenase subunit 2 [Thoradonta yunnana]WCF77150.1 NADH dehydrogenase subunit 2 [Thoradonta yunnana]WCK12000.1 NADH dehydrogenase subunit 2 [Thoradonta yunnana]
MNKAPMKMLFIILMSQGTLISVTSNNWLGIWMGLEINLLSFIPLITYNKGSNMNSSGIKYFIVQSIASITMLTSITSLMIYDHPYVTFITSLTAISILMKMGAAPLHFWFPEIMENLEWNNCIIMMTWQKIAPMLILSYLEITQKLVELFIISSALIGAIMGLNQISLRLIMSYSSISHMGWMMAALFSNSTIWMIYFLTYTLMTTLISISFKSNNIFMINEIYLNKNFNKMNKFNLALSFLSLGGMPPLLGFLPKWILIEQLMINSQYLINFTLIISSVITLYFYMKMFMSAGLISSQENSWHLNNMLNKPLDNLASYLNLLSTLGIILSSVLFL